MFDDIHYSERHVYSRARLMAQGFGEDYDNDRASLEWKIEDCKRRREVPTIPNYMAHRLASIKVQAI